MGGLWTLLAGRGSAVMPVGAVVLGSELAPAAARLEAAAEVRLRQRGMPFWQVSIESVGCIPASENCQSNSGESVVMGKWPGRGRMVCQPAARRGESVYQLQLQ